MPTTPYDPNRSHPVFPLFCPCPQCPYYQDLENVITKAGTYLVQGGSERCQRLYCQAGQHRFTESAYSPLFRHHGSLKEYVQVAKLTTYRLSPEEIADETGVKVWAEELQSYLPFWQRSESLPRWDITISPT